MSKEKNQPEKDPEYSGSIGRKEFIEAVESLKKKYGDKWLTEWDKTAAETSKWFDQGAKGERRIRDYQDNYDTLTSEQLTQKLAEYRAGLASGWIRGEINFPHFVAIVSTESAHRKTRGIRKLILRTFDNLTDRLEK